MRSVFGTMGTAEVLLGPLLRATRTVPRDWPVVVVVVVVMVRRPGCGGGADSSQYFRVVSKYGC